MSSRKAKHRWSIGGAAAIGALALAFTVPSAANAHVTINTDTDTAGSYTVLMFSVGHGCGESPTTSVAIQIPAGINSVTPTRNAFYDVKKVFEKLSAPIVDAHGNAITERVAEVVYTANTPLPADQRDAFELSLQLPADAAGKTLYFPTVQKCESGKTVWAQIPAAGQDPHALEAPAPSLTVTEATTGHGHGDGHGDDGHADEPTPATGADQTPLIITSLAVGGAGLVVGLFSLIRGRKRA
jgi:uncharacterized protein YcnI